MNPNNNQSEPYGTNDEYIYGIDLGPPPAPPRPQQPLAFSGNGNSPASSIYLSAHGPEFDLNFHDTQHVYHSEELPSGAPIGSDHFQRPSVALDPDYLSDNALDEEEEFEEEEEEEQPATKYSFFSLNFYRQLFNVDTDTFINRVIVSFFPYRKSFLESTKDNPDLYGFLWINLTLIFIVAASGNFARYLKYALNGKESEFVFDFGILVTCTFVTSFYALLVPLVLWVALAWYDDFDFRLPQAYCLYGYSMSAFVIAAIICVVPNNALQWCMILVAFCISSVNICISMMPLFQGRGKLVLFSSFAYVLALHFTLSLFFLLYCYK